MSLPQALLTPPLPSPIVGRAISKESWEMELLFKVTKTKLKTQGSRIYRRQRRERLMRGI